MLFFILQALYKNTNPCDILRGHFDCLLKLLFKYMYTNNKCYCMYY